MKSMFINFLLCCLILFTDGLTQTSGDTDQDQTTEPTVQILWDVISSGGIVNPTSGNALHFASVGLITAPIDDSSQFIHDPGFLVSDPVIFEQYTLQMDLTFGHTNFIIDVPIWITAKITNKGIPITGATVTAQVKRPHTDSPEIIELLDDGLNSDGAANDGIYANRSIVPEITGYYTYIVNAEGISSTDRDFFRTDTVTTVVTERLEFVENSPDANEINVDDSTNIAVTFDQGVIPFLITTNDFIVTGTQTGIHNGDFILVNGDSTVIFNSNKNFTIGEEVTVTLTTGLGLRESHTFSFKVGANQGSMTFNEAPGSPYMDVRKPTNIITADFDNNGILDVAVAREFSRDDLGNRVDIYIGDGTGSFKGPAKVFDLGSDPGQLIAADLNRDGFIDLVVAMDRRSVAVLLAQGDFNFASPVFYRVRRRPERIEAGDFNRDGNPDLAVSNHLTGDISILLGKGDGTFEDQSRVRVDPLPRALALGDFNNDGKLDIASASGDNKNKTVIKGGMILLGDGKGVFDRKIAFDPGEGPFRMVTGDFNEDGTQDLVIANEDDAGRGSSRAISVLLGNGDGSFSSPKKFQLDEEYVEPRAVTVGDYIKDGHLDIAVATSFPGRVFILQGDGSGSFSAPIHNIRVGDEANSIISGDFNNDGILDIATANYGTPINTSQGTQYDPGTITVLLGQPGLPRQQIKKQTPQQLPLTFHLEQNHPNPFNPITNIKYQLPGAAHVTVQIFNTLGQRIKTLINENKTAGFYNVFWNGVDQNGNQVSSGIYLYTIHAGDFVSTKKMAFLK